MTDETTIRGLITRWAAAVRAADLDGVLADHDPNIVMFDVPPPHDGIRGIDAYRASWPPFFEWLSNGGIFEIVELHVMVGGDVAFGYGLLRCGLPADVEAHPDTRLRLTVGLRKTDGRWAVTHEHHSFPATD